MADYGVNVASASDQDAVLDALMLTFGADPCIRYTFPKPQTYLAAFRPFATAMGAGAFAAGGAWMADDGPAALWLPPGVEPDFGALGGLSGEVAAPEKQAVIGEVVENMGRRHPHERHWRLTMVGVDHARQGQGLGSAMLKAGLERCDADGLIAHLESSNPKNLLLYAPHGVEVIGLIQPGDFPPLYPMLRPARR